MDKPTISQLEGLKRAKATIESLVLNEELQSNEALKTVYNNICKDIKNVEPEIVVMGHIVKKLPTYKEMYVG